MIFRPSIGCTMGADPELFLRNTAGQIVGSHELLAEPSIGVNGGKIARDGVQVELQPTGTSGCRQTLSTYIQYVLQHLQIITTVKSLTPCWEPVVELTADELASMPDDARQLGCQPSENIYGPSPITVPPDWPVRSAGGHIHLGIGGKTLAKASASCFNWFFWNERPVERTIALMDVLLGIPSVILDRSNQQLRRTAYGRAGEFRFQPHGLEYRTLSNFWLRDYKLESLMFGLAKAAVTVQMGYITTGHDPKTYSCTIANHEDSLAPLLLKASNPTEIQQIINENDLKGAVEVWKRVIQWAKQLQQGSVSSNSTIYYQNLEAVLTVGEIGIEELWPSEGLVERWGTRGGTPYGTYGPGWEAFCLYDVQNLRKRKIA